jgi:hypothetical protein
MLGICAISGNDEDLPMPAVGIDVALPLFNVPANTPAVGRVELCDVTDLQIASCKSVLTGRCIYYEKSVKSSARAFAQIKNSSLIDSLLTKLIQGVETRRAR